METSDTSAPPLPTPPPLPAPQAVAPPIPHGPRLPTALLVSCLAIVTAAAAAIPFGIYYAVQSKLPDILLLTIVGQMVSWPVALWLGLVFVKRSWSQAYAINRFPWRILPGLVIGCFGFTVLLNYLMGFIPMPEAVEQTFTSLGSGHPILVFISISLIAPIAEELFFRGWMLRGFLANYSPWRAIWMTSVIFALFHLNPWQAAVALPLGLIFGWLALRTGSLAPGIIGHFLVNSTTTYLLFPFALLLGHSPEELAEATQLPLDMVAAGTLLTLVGAAWMLWDLRTPQEEKAVELA